MHSFAWWPTLILLVVATVTDLCWRRIPNWLVFPFLVTGIAVSGWTHGWHGLGQSSAGVGLGLFIPGVFFWMGGMGAGDVKLCSALGAWIGPMQLLIALVASSLAGGVMVLCWAILRGFVKDLICGVGKLIMSWRRRQNLAFEDSLGRRMPYAPAIAVGTLLSFFAR